MPPVFFQYVTSYQIGRKLFDVQFLVHETDLIPLSEREWAGFGVYSDKYKDVESNFLFLFLHSAEYSPIIGSLFDSRLVLNEEDLRTLEDIGSRIELDLNAKAINLLKLFRWLTGLPFDLQLRGKPVPLQWSVDRILWEFVPYSSKTTSHTTDFFGDDPTPIVDKSLIESLIAPNVHLSEPLGHDLLYEAFRLYDSNDLRGAFTIGYSALEVGVKEFIQRKVPSAAWLMANSPSPDMLKMCNQYLPSLDERLSIEGTLEKRLINKYMTSRNSLVHKGLFNEENLNVLKKLRMVEYMLYRFDYCLGLERALLYVERAKEKMETLGL